MVGGLVEFPPTSFYIYIYIYIYIYMFGGSFARGELYQGGSPRGGGEESVSAVPWEEIGIDVYELEYFLAV
jgi:hypothetical protein